MAEFEPKQFGKYYLLEKLAVGGMAEIYKAKIFGVDGFEKQLALKRILPHCCADKDFITMLADEAKLSVLLSHANIVQVYDLGKVGDDYFISMEYINGPNLRDINYRCREKNTSFPTELAVYLISEVCKGLDYAHRKTDQNLKPLNIVHRDVSPQNILISYEGEVKIVDFGIAKAAMNISHTMAGILKGKIAYMSPEQALGKTIDHRTDIFSVGIVLYETLTGEKLYTGESQFEVLKKIRTTRVTEESLPKDVPDDLKKIIAKTLAYFPKDRYQSAGQLQIDLTRFLYQKYVDFTPQKLAAFIKELFSDELKRQQSQAAREAALEAQTSSMNVAQEAMQENIVHREDTGITIKEHELGTGMRGTGLAPPPEITRLKRLRFIKRLISAGMILAFLTGMGFIYTKYIHPMIFKQVPTTGTASIVSVPAGAKVILDGEETGLSTPAILDDLKLGREYSVKTRKEGFADQSKAFTLRDTELKTFSFELKKAMGTLEIASTPEGAGIKIDNEDTGKVTPATISNLELGRETKVVVSLKGYRDKTEKITLEGMEPKKLEFELEKVVYGTIRVTSEPSGASISLNGRGTGKTTPAAFSGLEQGESYRFYFSKSGYEAESRTVALDKDEVSVSISLKKGPEKTTLSVSSTPSGAAISLNGKRTGKTTPATLSDMEIGKSYRITLSMNGYDTVTDNAFIAGKAPQSFSKTLTKSTVTPPPPPTGEKGSLKVTSNPSGASIYLDGGGTGKQTPATLTGLDTGKTYSIRLEKEGYESWAGSKFIASTKTQSLSATLKSSGAVTPPPPPPPPPSGGTGTLIVKSDPTGADIYINSERRGKTTATIKNVPTGSVMVTVSKKGYENRSTTIPLSSGETKEVTLALAGGYGEVTIISTPPAADVIFDGQSIARTPVTVRKVVIGKDHSISVSLPGYRSWSRSFTMDGGIKSFNVILEKE